LRFRQPAPLFRGFIVPRNGGGCTAAKALNLLLYSFSIFRFLWYGLSSHICSRKVHNSVVYSDLTKKSEVKGENMKYTIDELTAAKRQIDSTLHKLRETVKTFESKDNSERYKSQITLAKRRIKAFEIANYFIENEIKNC
ncbi:MULTISPECIES: hypothetical protein, partial [Bacteria]